MEDFFGGMPYGFFGVVIAIAVLELLAPFIKRNVAEVEDTRVLRFNPAYRFLVAGLALSMLLLPYLLFTDSPDTSLVVKVVASCLAVLLTVHLIAWAHTTKIELTSLGIKLQRPWLQPVSIRWSEVKKIRYVRSSRSYEVLSSRSDGKIKVSVFMDGFQDFLQQVEARYPHISL